MILKTPRDTRITRIRVIHLYEQDYTMILAIEWRYLIHACERKGLLHPHQYGAVLGKNSVTPTILEELQYKISRESKRPLIHKDYDAMAYFDRIIMNMAGLITRGHGQHRSIFFINRNIPREETFVLKTQLDVSKKSYSHCTLFPIFGSGQGAGNSPGL